MSVTGDIFGPETLHRPAVAEGDFTCRLDTTNIDQNHQMVGEAISTVERR